MAFRWMKARDGVIPHNAFAGGYEDKKELYVARAMNSQDGYMTPGKAATHLSSAHITYAGKEIVTPAYEVLTVPPQYRKNFSWKFCTDGKLPENAFPTDIEGKLYVARFAHNSTLHPGKLVQGEKTAFIGYDLKEISSSSYEVLCYKADC